MTQLLSPFLFKSSQDIYNDPDLDRYLSDPSLLDMAIEDYLSLFSYLVKAKNPVLLLRCYSSGCYKKSFLSLRKYFKRNPGQDLALKLLREISTLNEFRIWEMIFDTKILLNLLPEHDRKRKKGVKRKLRESLEYFQTFYSTLLLEGRIKDEKLREYLLLQSLEKCTENFKKEFIFNSYIDIYSPSRKSIRISYGERIGGMSGSQSYQIYVNSKYCIFYTDFRSSQLYRHLKFSLTSIESFNSYLLDQIQGDPNSISLYIASERLRILDQRVLEPQTLSPTRLILGGQLDLYQMDKLMVSVWIVTSDSLSDTLVVKDVLFPPNLGEEKKLSDLVSDTLIPLSVLVDHVEKIAKDNRIPKVSFVSSFPDIKQFSLKGRKYKKDRSLEVVGEKVVVYTKTVI